MARKVIHLGRQVICDMCGDDWTDRPEVGGILFQSKACCPNCTPELEKSAKRYNEEWAIKGRCPETMSYADWVRNVLRPAHPLGDSIVIEEFKMTNPKPEDQQ